MSRGAQRLWWIGVMFLIAANATRIGLAWYSGESFEASQWFQFMALGLVFDLAVMPFFLLPWAIYDAVMPQFTRQRNARKWENRWAMGWACAFVSGFIISAASEFTFWTEFSSRFDFIAVDYLVYTHEVIGNIVESYPLPLWFSLIFAAAFAIVWLLWPQNRDERGVYWPLRWGRIFLIMLWILVGYFGVDAKFAEDKNNTYVEQLSLNGLYAFGHAFFHNELDYNRYYPTLVEDELNDEIRRLVDQPLSQFIESKGIARKVTPTGPERNLNVILISVESLSADYMAHFGNKENITPELDQLADKGLFFTNLYATGTRTVRGLEALSVGTPPTPGQSIVRRPNNDHLENLGEELAEKGWQPMWVYGGYGLFDNMNAYFESNGYSITDRTDAEATKIHFENVWGIADEDLYTLAMDKVDQQFAQGNRFFAHVMTTSNHRPYTFPENRIDMPQKKRESAVKYTDWAIGDFIRRASEKPWFKDTLFVIVADHTSKAAGKADLPIWRYHIPMIWYAPDHIEPATMDRLMSQIDIAPSLLGWLGQEYSSRFFGYDIFNLEPGRERAFISTYQKLGYMKAGRLVVMDVKKSPTVGEGLDLSAISEQAQITDSDLTKEAIAWYQAASNYFRDGLLKDVDDGDKPGRSTPASVMAEEPALEPTSEVVPAPASEAAPAPAAAQ